MANRLDPDLGDIEMSAVESPSHKLSETNEQAVRRLENHVGTLESLAELGLRCPRNKLAAVLVLLFEKEGVLRVLLTTRSKTLRSHPGQTALPGGKCEPQDDSFLATALRESYEECGLDPSSPSLRYLTQLPHFLSQWKLIVIPIVVLCTDPAMIDKLAAPSADEVSRIFSHPLEAILDPPIALNEQLSEMGGPDWPYEEDLYNMTDNTWTQMENTIYRMHRFRTCASRITGLTSDILIMVAEVAFSRPTIYTRYAPGQETQQQLADRVIEDYQGGGSRVPARLPELGATGLKSRDEEATR